MTRPSKEQIDALLKNPRTRKEIIKAIQKMAKDLKAAEKVKVKNRR